MHRYTLKRCAAVATCERMFPGCVAAIVRALVPMRLAVGDRLLLPGWVAEEAYFVIRGTLRAVPETHRAKQQGAGRAGAQRGHARVLPSACAQTDGVIPTPRAATEADRGAPAVPGARGTFVAGDVVAAPVLAVPQSVPLASRVTLYVPRHLRDAEAGERVNARAARAAGGSDSDSEGEGDSPSGASSQHRECILLAMSRAQLAALNQHWPSVAAMLLLSMGGLSGVRQWVSAAQPSAERQLDSAPARWVAKCAELLLPTPRPPGAPGAGEAAATPEAAAAPEPPGSHADQCAAFSLARKALLELRSREP